MDVPIEKLDYKVQSTQSLNRQQRLQLHELFKSTYREANSAYLNHSLSVLGYVAMACADQALVGFALGGTVTTSLPRLDAPQTVRLGGIGCINPAYRRLGLFGRLGKLIRSDVDCVDPGSRVLSCGRMAHPVGFRSMSRNPTVVPKFGVPITAWQKEIGLRVAELYGVELDPDSFVVKGKGIPVGYPDIEVDVPASEWRLFEAVDRSRGDSLLGIAWAPEAPAGW